MIKILAWFAGAIVAHDLVLLPLYSLLDRVALRRRRASVYVRIPALLSGLLLIVFLPAIARLGATTYHASSGLNQDVYLGRWVAATAVMFGVSGAIYLFRRRAAVRARTPPSRPRSPRAR